MLISYSKLTPPIYKTTTYVFSSYQQASKRNNRNSNPNTTMISLKKLIAMARKWQKLAGIGGQRAISMPHKMFSRVAHKGHFVVYSMDKRRFVIPLVYLSSSLFKELLRMSEEEFGLPGDGPITLPCDAAFMEYVVMVAERRASEELQMALIVSLVASSSSTHLAKATVYDHGLCCSSNHRQISIHGF